MPEKDFKGFVNNPQIQGMVVGVKRYYPAVGSGLVQKISLVYVYCSQIKGGFLLFRLGKHTLFIEIFKVIKVNITFKPVVKGIGSHRVYNYLCSLGKIKGGKAGTKPVKGGL